MAKVPSECCSSQEAFRDRKVQIPTDPLTFAVNTCSPKEASGVGKRFHLRKPEAASR